MGMSYDEQLLHARHACVLIEEAGHLGSLLAPPDWLRQRAATRESHADVVGADALNDFHAYVVRRMTLRRAAETRPRWWSLGFNVAPRSTKTLLSASALLLRADELMNGDGS